MSKREPYDAVADQMRRDWNERAKKNARHYVATGRDDWSDDEFFRSGEAEVADIVLKDIGKICGARDASAMRVLEIGCGAGRMTAALGKIFGHVDAVDISIEMISQARDALSGRPNIQLHVNNGVDLSLFPDNSFDFALSAIVFQHIPRKAIVENYIRDTHRVLRPQSFFKFQVQGCPIPENQADTWVGAGFTESEMADCASRCSFEIKSSDGAGTQYYWLTFLKP